MTRRHATAGRVKIHHNYTPEEAADITGYHPHTIRRWIKSGALSALTERKPHLILGRVLKAFLTAPKAGKAKLRPGECYCVKCRQPKRPALDMAEFIPLSPSAGNLCGFCPDCETLMHRRVALARLSEIAAGLEVTSPHAERHLRERCPPSVNVDFEKVNHGQSKVLP